MRVFIMRHGEAVLHFDSDADRNITEKGKLECRQSAQWIGKHLVLTNVIDLALVSPYIRAKQSFSTVADTNQVSAIEETADLVPSGSPQLASDYIQYHLRHSEVTNLLIVSHMPLVSYLLDELSQQQHSILFATAAVAMLDIDYHQGVRLLDVFQPALQLS